MSGQHLYGGVNAEYTDDRFGNENSAIHLNNGYIKIPDGTYFNGNFTITAWIKLKSIRWHSRLFDFGNDSENNLMFTFWGTSSNILFRYSRSNFPYPKATQRPVELNKWTHFAASLEGNIAKTYLNGELQATNLINPPLNLNTKSNFIGHSNNHLYGDQDVDAIFDDIKIYDRALDLYEIQQDEHKLTIESPAINEQKLELNKVKNEMALIKNQSEIESIKVDLFQNLFDSQMTNILNKFENTQNQLETQGIKLDSFKQSFDSQILNILSKFDRTQINIQKGSWKFEKFRFYGLQTRSIAARFAIPFKFKPTVFYTFKSNHTHNNMALLYKIFRETIDNYGINAFIEFYGAITIHEAEIEWIAIGY